MENFQVGGRFVASYADILWARHAIFLPHVRGGGRLRDEPKECLRRRLDALRLSDSTLLLLKVQVLFARVCLSDRKKSTLDDKSLEGVVVYYCKIKMALIYNQVG